MHIRSTNWGEPNAEARIVIKDGEKEIISPALPEVQLSILAHAFAGHYFQKTKRVAWPTDGVMLAVYQKEQDAAEDRHLDWMRNSPAVENQAQAPAFEERMRQRRQRDQEQFGLPDETLDVQRQAEAPAPELVVPARRRSIL